MIPRLFPTLLHILLDEDLLDDELCIIALAWEDLRTTKDLSTTLCALIC